MARKKRGKNGGKVGGASRRAQSRGIASQSDDSSPNGFSPKEFSLHDEARNSEHPRSFWSSSQQQLRNQSITFVRGAQQPAESDSDTHGQSLQEQAASQRQSSTDLDYNQPSNKGEMGMDCVLTWDVKHARAEKAGLGPNVLVPSSPGASSEDEVVFTGRSRVASRRHLFLRGLEMSQESLKPLPPPQIERTCCTGKHGPASDFIPLHVLDQRAQSKPGPTNRKYRSQSQIPMKILPSSKSADLARDDYLANVRSYGEVARMDDDEEYKPSADDWSDVQDCGSVEISDDFQGVVSQVLSKRQSPSGLQYLIVLENQLTDCAHWIAYSSIPLSAAPLIDAFEDPVKLAVAVIQKGDGQSDEESEACWGTEVDSNGNDDSGGQTEDDLKDESDLIERRSDRMTDEHMARLLQKQESLGIFSDDLEIYDGEEDPNVSDTILVLSPAKQRVRKDQRRARLNTRAVASTLQGADDVLEEKLDEYGSFDVMDRDRPSIFQPFRNFTNSLPFDVSDSDIAGGFNAAWEMDRRKKKAKKQEREELRALGLLGKKNKVKPDLKARYNTGMSLEHIEKEIEDFIFDDSQRTLSLPPMEKRDRKSMHDIANVFGLTSKSQGSGRKRFTILFKTSRTPDFDKALFVRLRGQLNRRFFSRMDKAQGGNANKRGGGPGVRADVGYREGDVVGATAPELGSENRGRAMLEKMGWSMGTALGASNNQGILQPIQHVVRNTKAGLG